MSHMDKIKLGIIIIVIFIAKIHFFPDIFSETNNETTISKVTKIGQNYKYSKLEAQKHEMTLMNDDHNQIGKTIMVQTNYKDWNISYNVLDEDNRTININDNGKITFNFTRFKYADYDTVNKKEIISSKNYNNISFLRFSFDNGDNFDFNYHTLNNSRVNGGWVEAWKTINGVETNVEIHKETNGYSLKTDYAFIGDLLASDNLTIYIKYKNHQEETKEINLKEFREYIAYEKSYLE